MQGSVSGPEHAKPAQSPILALRAVSKAYYRTYHGREVRAAGFVDDTEHYGGGALDLAIIVRELSLGSIATGIGFAWPKFTAFATDWDKAVRSIGYPFSPTGILTYGLVPRAMAFLAGYGIYVTVATDKLVGRMLDNYAAKHNVHGHPLVGPFNS